MPSYQDQLQNKLQLSDPPQRIVSLVPSQTELLHDLGLGDRVVGITKFCIHPEKWYREKTRIGGTKNVDFKRVAELKPDLIIGNKEENNRADIEQLQQHYPVWMSDIYTLEDAYAMMLDLGDVLDVTSKAEALVLQIRTGMSALQQRPFSNKRVAYFIWRKPWMVAAAHTFIHHLLGLAGWVNVYAGQQRYPVVTLEDVAAAKPEVLLLSSEPYPFKEKHQAELAAVCPQAQIELVDGELFSWYGSRLLHTANYIKNIQQKLER
jgi:ABC-type Fe3+-hydroxamate transport system substrate-binding protein